MFVTILFMTKGEKMNNWKYLKKEAQKKYKTIVFPEASFSDRIIESTKIINRKKIAKVILIADESAIAIRFKKLKDITIINPKTSELAKEFAEKLFELRKEKGLTKVQAKKLVLDPFYFSAMFVKEGYADGMVAGAEVPTAQTLKPALQIIKTKTGFASSSMLLYGKNKKIKLPIMISDPALNVEPTSEQLAIMAEQTANTMKMLYGDKITPKVAFLSFSTKGSAKSESVEKMEKATEIFKMKSPNILSDGELQLDSAVVPFVASKKCPNSIIQGRANILIVPDLNSGNILYKSMQYFGSLMAIGPITMGLNKPVNDLSRGCSVEDIVRLTIITALQCEK